MSQLILNFYILFFLSDPSFVELTKIYRYFLLFKWDQRSPMEGIQFIDIFNYSNGISDRQWKESGYLDGCSYDT